MERKHIQFWELERDDPVDRIHLAECESCRRGWQAAQALRYHLDRIPRADAPPFFASRVAARVREQRVPFMMLLQNAAQRLTPLFVTLAVAFGLLIYLAVPQDDIDAGAYAGLIFDLPIREEFSLEDVVLALQEPYQESDFSEGTE